MDAKSKQQGLSKEKTKKKYTPPEVKEVWSENIGMKGTFLLEM